jgi:hypothetical protein
LGVHVPAPETTFPLDANRLHIEALQATGA